MGPAGCLHGSAWSGISAPGAAADIPVSRIAVFTDPGGNRIGLVSR
jgi:predicted enzyme related to lactoylglutathione lyase